MAVYYNIKACRFCGTESFSRIAHQRYCSLTCAFWSGVHKGAACWLWTKGLMSTGYGYIDFQRARHFTHRLVWELINGPIPNGLFVLHKCDNPACVNPKHLFLGTQKDNRQDCVTKLHHSFGSRHGMSKLSENNVLSIRASSKSAQDLAKRFGLAPGYVREIKRRESWRHI